MVQTHGGFFRQNDSRISIFLQTLNTRLPFKLGSVWPQTLPKRVSDDPRHFIFRRRKNFFETSNGRLPPKHGSDRRETLPKRVSGDPQHFIFRRPQTFLATKFFVGKIFREQPENFFSKVPVLEQL